MIQAIVFLPLLAALVAGLGQRAIGPFAAKLVTTGALFTSCALSWPIFLSFVFGTGQAEAEKIDPDLMNQVVTQFGNVDDALAKLRDKTAPGGYLPWTAANREKHRKELSQAVLALQQPMQKIAEKVATAQ